MVTACGAKETVFPPEEIQEGVDRCTVCNMLVPNDHNATQLLLKDGRSLKFDDIGDMAKWVEDNGMSDVNVRYVRDYHTEEWIKIEDATFVYDADFRTPMAYGVYSFKSKDAAKTFVEGEGKGKLLSYKELQNHTWTMNMDQMNHHHDHQGHQDHDHEHDEGEGHNK